MIMIIIVCKKYKKSSVPQYFMQLFIHESWEMLYYLVLYTHAYFAMR